MQTRRKEYYKRTEDYVPKIYAPTDLAYMAGIVDGEGCFFMAIVPKRKGDGYISEHFRGLLKISNTDKKLIDWIMDTFQGSQSSVKRLTSTRRFERDVYDWISTGDRLLDISEQILPYLVIKKRHCEVMIKFRKTYVEKLGSHRLSDESIRVRHECLNEIRNLNSRFHLHPMKQINNLGPCHPVGLPSQSVSV